MRPRQHIQRRNILQRAILIRVPDEAMGHTTSLCVEEVRTANMLADEDEIS